MLRRNLSQLAIYTIEEEVEALPLSCLHKLYFDKASENIYVIEDKQLYGVICMGEALHPDADGYVRINRNFTKMIGYNVIKAHEIFSRKAKIHSIPIINERGELLGDYSRWDDKLYIERNQKLLLQENLVKRILKPYDKVYVIEPIDGDDSRYLNLVKYLNSFQVSYQILRRDQIREKLLENSICIFTNEDERRCVQCLYGIEPWVYDSQGHNIYSYDLLVDRQLKLRLATYKSLLIEISRKGQLERLGIQADGKLFVDRIDDKASILLATLKERGIKCFHVRHNENYMTKYGVKFQKNLAERLREHPLDLKEPWIKRADNEEFYGELYQIEDYANESAQKEIFDAMHNYMYQCDVTGKYFNAKEGRRVTCFQPQKYQGTIYFLGPCWVIGAFVEDQYTVESWLQKKLLEKGYAYKVENYGEMMRLDAAIDMRLMEIGEFQTNDIIVYQSGVGEVADIEGSSLEKFYEKHNIPVEWVTDNYGHCNHKANQLLADSILETIEPYLCKQITGKEKGRKKIDIDFCTVMKAYMQHKYFNQYFSEFSVEKYNTIGAVVVKCNPFHLGHRYLIEEAKSKVDFLIVFILEEEEFLFPFEERFQLIEEGIKDLDNILVVPNGDFILSSKTFPQFYSKADNRVVVLNAEYDAFVFAEYVAKVLHITHRFTGKNPKGKIEKVYYEAMRKILPQKGIIFEEIPRKEIEGEGVSSSKVRRRLKDQNYREAFSLLPYSTVRYLKEQLNLY